MKLKDEISWLLCAAVIWPVAKVLEFSWGFSSWKSKRSRPKHARKHSTLDQGQLLSLLRKK